MRFAILGTLAVTTGQAPVAVTAARERATLAMLLLSPNQTVTTGRLIDAVWDDRTPVRALSQLHACVSRLRSRLAQGGLPRSLIATAPAGGGYSITVGRDQLDSLEFAWQVGQARAAMAREQRETAHRHYREALELWRGPALDGVGGPTLRRLAAGLDEQRLRAQQDCLTLELELGRAAEVLPELTDLAARHPYHEPLHRLLMLALYRAGRQADAAEVYRRYDRALRDEVGTEAGEQLRQLHQAILRRDPGLGLGPVPPASTATSIPHELPTQVAGFTGRADTLAALTKAVSGGMPAGPVTILAITGSPGIGKTAVAVYWAHRTADRFPDGQLFVNLRGSHPTGALRPVEALTAMLRSLGRSALEIPHDEARAAAVFRSMLAGRSVLVLLDDAGSAEQVRPLLPGSSGCAVLVTSRDRLSGLAAHDGASRFPLDVLTATEAYDLLSGLLGQDRVAAEPDAASALAETCAGLPLALRIAAAHLADRPAATIASYLTELRSGDRLAALRIDGDDASSVSTALGLSYQTLPADAARLLRLLGLVPGPDFTAPAAARLIDVPSDDAVRLLARLARSSLLTEPAPGRYAFHDLLRDFAIRLSESEDKPPERDAARDRLLRYYLHDAEAAADAAFGNMQRLPMPASDPGEPAARFDSRTTGLTWLDAERRNLVAAVAEAARVGPRSYAWLLSDRLRGLFWYTRHMPDWLSVAETGLAIAEQEGDERAAAAARVNLGDAYLVSGRHEETIPIYREAAELAHRTGWTDGQETALNNLGMAYIHLGRLAEAAEIYHRLLARHASDGQLPPRARLRQNLGVVGTELGQLDDAYTDYTEALALYRAIGNRSGILGVLSGLAMIDCRRGDIHKALGRASTASRIASEEGNPNHRLMAANALGLATRESGQPVKAIDLHRQAHEAAIRAHDSLEQAQALRYLADAHLVVDELDQASDAATESLALVRKTGAVVQEGPALNTLAETAYRQGRNDLAEAHAREALARHRETGQRVGEARTLAIFGLVSRATGRLPEAARYQQLATELYAEIGAAYPPRLRAPAPPST